MLKRLAIYALGKHDGWSADQKLAELLKADVIYGVIPDREVTELLQSQYPAASIKTRELVSKRQTHCIWPQESRNTRTSSSQGMENLPAARRYG